MLRSILNPGKVSNISSLRSAVEKWEEQCRAYERKKDANGLEEKLLPSVDNWSPSDTDRLNAQLHACAAVAVARVANLRKAAKRLAH
eukprot:3945878-Amphidinium_carterae.2